MQWSMLPDTVKGSDLHMRANAVLINVYYLGSEPSRGATVKRIGEVLKELGVAGEIRQIPINLIWASFLHFLGSPTVHINGRDIDPSARTSKELGFIYRTYRNGQQIEGVPSKIMIRDALLEAQTNVFIMPDTRTGGSSPGWKTG